MQQEIEILRKLLVKVARRGFIRATDVMAVIADEIYYLEDELTKENNENKQDK